MLSWWRRQLGSAAPRCHPAAEPRASVRRKGPTSFAERLSRVYGHVLHPPRKRQSLASPPLAKRFCARSAGCAAPRSFCGSLRPGPGSCFAGRCGAPPPCAATPARICRGIFILLRVWIHGSSVNTSAPKRPVAPLSTDAVRDQARIAGAADRLHGEPGAAGHLIDHQGQSQSLLTLHQ